MAYTKVFAIKGRLDKRIAYAVNAAKTGGFVNALNCGSPETAFAEMMDTKSRWQKPDGVLGYHFIQSFEPGEVTPEQAHAIGVAFAQRCFGADFEVVIGTHLDQKHLHNHIMVNSVAWTDGHKYHSSPASYYNEIRGTSDALCRENGLSVIAPQGKGKHYAQWKAENEGKPTVSSLIKADIDAAIPQSLTFKSFLENLQRRGYRIRAGPNRKHISVCPPGHDHFFRLDTLKGAYTQEAVKARIQGQATNQFPSHQKPVTYHYRYRGMFPRARKLHGFRALYYHYLYFFGKIKKRQAPKRVDRALAGDLAKLDRYVAQFKFVSSKKIHTAKDLVLYQDAVEVQIDALTDRRQGVYTKRRRCTDEEEKAALSAQAAQLTQELRALRREKRLCGQIEADSARIRGQLHAAEKKTAEVKYMTTRQMERGKTK